MAGFFPRTPIEPETVAAYFDELREFDADIVLAALRQHARTSKWLPTVCELLDLIAPEQAARSAWELPDFTGFAKLAEAEQVKLLEQGLTASRGVEGAGGKRKADRPLLTDGSGA